MKKSEINSEITEATQLALIPTSFCMVLISTVHLVHFLLLSIKDKKDYIYSTLKIKLKNSKMNEIVMKTFKSNLSIHINFK